MRGGPGRAAAGRRRRGGGRGRRGGHRGRSGTEAAAAPLAGADRAWWAETGPGLRPASAGRRSGSRARAACRWWSCRHRPTGATWPPGWPPRWGGRWWPAPSAPSAVRTPAPTAGNRVRADGVPARRPGAPAGRGRRAGRGDPGPGSAERRPARPRPGTGGRPPPPGIGPGRPVARRPGRAPTPRSSRSSSPTSHTMDLADATRVVAGGAGLAAGCDDRRRHRASSTCWSQVAAAIGGSAGATRVATDAGWTGYERQIGTTGVTVDPDLYIAFGVSGAAQHVGGLGTPTARRQRQHRRLVADDGHGRPRPGHRRPALCWSSWAGASASACPPTERRAAPGRRPDGTRARMPDDPIFDAVVVGAGPAGSAAALALARAGRSVVLVERGPFPGVEERLRRRGLRAGPRRHRPRLVGGGAGRALGGPALDDDDDRRPSRCPSTTGPRPGVRPPTTA